MFLTRWIAMGVIALVSACGVAGCDRAKIHTGSTPQQSGKMASEKDVVFDPFEVGRTPPGFTTALTGGGGPVSWIIQEDATTPGGKKVLAQTSGNATGYRFPLCVVDEVSAKDVAVSVQFKSVSGKVDEAGGVVLRYQDKDNYYVARANALEDNVRLYKVQRGKRSKITGISTKVLPGVWHTLTLEAHGTHFIVAFDDEWFEVDDGTFREAGKVGLWTKADSVTYFDDLKIRNYDGQ